MTEERTDSTERDEREPRWTEWANWILAGILVFVLGAYLNRYLNSTDPGALVGSTAPAWTLETARGGEIRLADYHGEVVVLDFWATWCGVCERQMPVLEEAMARSEVADRATLVLVNTQERGSGQVRRDAVRRYLEQRDLEFPTVLDDGSTLRDYRVRGLPTLVVIDGQGTVTYAGSGMHSADGIAEKVRDAFDR